MFLNLSLLSCDKTKTPINDETKTPTKSQIIKSQIRKVEQQIKVTEKEVQKNPKTQNSQLETLKQQLETLKQQLETLKQQLKIALQREKENQEKTYLIMANGNIFFYPIGSHLSGSVTLEGPDSLGLNAQWIMLHEVSHGNIKSAAKQTDLKQISINEKLCIKVKAAEFSQLIKSIKITTNKGNFAVCSGDCTPAHYNFNGNGFSKNFVEIYGSGWVDFSKSSSRKGQFRKAMIIPVHDYTHISPKQTYSQQVGIVKELFYPFVSDRDNKCRLITLN